MIKLSRSTIWLGVFVLAVATFAGIWFLMNFQRVPHEVRSDPGAEARRNQFLAAQRLLKSDGFSDKEMSPSSADLASQLAARDTLILGSSRTYSMTEARTNALLDWVAQGGYLILESGYSSTNDHLLHALDVTVLVGQAAESDEERATREAAEKKRKAQNHDDSMDSDDGDNDPDPADVVGTNQKQKRYAPHTVPVNIPGYARTLKFPTGYSAIQAGERPPEWSAESPERARLMHFTHGRGHITVINCLCQLNNWQIDEGDHAELLLALLRVYQPHGAVMWVQHLQIPTLWEWLAAHAQPALWSAALLLLGWLWYIMPRFGVIKPEATIERRSLLEHLRGMGRYLWRTHSLDVLLQSTRQQLWGVLQRHAPDLNRLPAQEQTRWVAQQANMSPQLVHLALHESLTHPEQFTQAIRTLKQLEQSFQQGTHHGIK